LEADDEIDENDKKRIDQRHARDYNIRIRRATF